MANTVKFFWNGIKINGTFHKCFYSPGPYTATSQIPEGTVTLYEDGYSHIPRIPELHITNDSDIMTDYFETDTIRIFPDSPLYEEALKGLKAAEIHSAKRSVKHFEKWLEKRKGTRHEWFYQQELEKAKERLAALTA